jgi:hypothetical protein
MFLRLLRLLALMNAIRRDNPALWFEITEFAANTQSLPAWADDGGRALEYRDPDPPAGKEAGAEC